MQVVESAFSVPLMVGFSVKRREFVRRNRYSDTNKTERKKSYRRCTFPARGGILAPNEKTEAMFAEATVRLWYEKRKKCSFVR